jgi:hypothetical protein
MSNTTATIPTHQFQAIILANKFRKRCRTPWVGFVGDEITARVECARRFPNYTIESIVVKVAPVVKKSVKLNEQHDYLTLTAIFPDARVNITTSYGGKKVSGSTSEGRAFLNAFAAYDKKANRGTTGEMMRRVAAMAIASATSEEFLATLETAAAS